MADDDVVEEVDADEVAGLGHATGEGEVLGAGGGIAGGVVVAEDQARGVEGESDLEDGPGLDGSAVEGADVGDGPADQAVAGVEVDADHVLLRAGIEDLAEEAGHVAGMIHAQVAVGGVLLLDEGDAVAGYGLNEGR